MAMRITTKMMQNTSMNNLNTNKTLQDKLTTQMSTGKKLTRPSDDPVVAIRSLKLNSELNKIDQYYEKNAEDAENWLDLTESAVSTVNTILENIRGDYLTQCAQGSLTADDRSSIMENISNLMDELYATGNSTSAGRNIFTGYRTDTSLTVEEDKTEWNKITEQTSNLSLDTVTRVISDDLVNINEGNFDTEEYENYTEYQVDTIDVARLRLSYDDLDYDETDEVSLSYFTTDEATGKRTEHTIDITSYYQYATDEAYQAAYNDDDAVVFIAETGEILLGENVQQKLAALSSDDEIRVSYVKSDWEEGDLDPVHYFYTERHTDTRGEDNPLIYNEEKIDEDEYEGNVAQQIIEYDVGSNQSVRVNTTADELYTHDMGRDADELISLLEQYDSFEDTYSTVEDMIDSGDYTDEELETLNKQLAALDKARTYAKDALQDKAEELLTTFNGYIEQAALARTDVGSRLSRVSLVKNRLSAQQTSYEELVSENEDADYTELAIQLSSVELTYEAALSSISYVMKTTLLDYI